MSQEEFKLNQKRPQGKKKNLFSFLKDILGLKIDTVITVDPWTTWFRGANLSLGGKSK